MNIEHVPISKVIPWDKNPRGITQKDYARLKKQIEELGVYKPLVAVKENGKYVVLGGNMRIRALKELGHDEVEISVVKARTEAERIKYALSDNDRAGFYEEEKLAELVYPHLDEIDLAEFKVDLGEALDLKQVVERFGPDIDDGADDVPEIDDTPAVTKTGDLFALGKHRVMCGDSTKAEDVARLMRGEKADMVFTDPPYGANIIGGGGITHFGKIGGGGITHFGKIGGGGIVDSHFYRRIEGDETSDVAKRGLINFSDIQDRIIFGGNYYDFLPISKCWIVWDKNNTGTFGDAELAWTSFHRAIRLYRHTWNGLQREGPRKEELKGRIHPTQKPVGLFSKILIDFSKEGTILADPFLGSGTTLIAAEKTGRICYGMEIDPKYCDVIIKRYADYVGVTEDSIRATREEAHA
jgi:DNA modification methylase